MPSVKQVLRVDGQEGQEWMKKLYCPKCFAEYREGFNQCADCEVSLAPGEAPDQTPSEDFPDVVGILDTNDNFALASACNALSQAGIIST
jgi:hypothetical protein